MKMQNSFQRCNIIGIKHVFYALTSAGPPRVVLKPEPEHMGQYQLLSVLAARLSPLNIDHSGNLPVEICGINYAEKYTNL